VDSGWNKPIYSWPAAYLRIVIIPPWLDVKPSDFTEASEAGARLGEEAASRTQQGQLERGNQALEGQRFAQEAQRASVQFGLEQQRLAAEEKQQGIENQIRREALDRNFQLATSRIAVADAYRQQTLDLRKQQLQQENQKFLKHLSDLHLYNVGLQGGMNPKDLAQRFPDAFAPGQWTDILRQPKEVAAPKMDEFTKKKLDSMYDIYNESIKNADAAQDATIKKAFNDRAASIQQQIQALQQTYSQPTAPGGTPPADQSQAAPGTSGMNDAESALSQLPDSGQPAPPPAAQPQQQASGIPAVGAVVSGFRFKGGDPSQETNWEQQAQQ
jgi:hypothetical protein